MPPFILKEGPAERIIEIVKRDMESIGEDGGLVESPAGVIPVGTPLENIKVYMWAVENYGRY